MHIIENSLNSLYQFWACKGWKIIQLALVMHEGAFAIGLLLWIVLEPCFQFSIFGKKFKFGYGFLAQLLWSFWIGFASVLMCEGFRSKKPNQNLCIHDFQDLILKDLFQYFFMKNHVNLLQFFPFLVCTKSLVNHEWLSCTKRFENLVLVFFIYFN